MRGKRLPCGGTSTRSVWAVMTSGRVRSEMSDHHARLARQASALWQLDDSPDRGSGERWKRSASFFLDLSEPDAVSVESTPPTTLRISDSPAPVQKTVVRSVRSSGWAAANQPQLPATSADASARPSARMTRAAPNVSRKKLRVSEASAVDVGSAPSVAVVLRRQTCNR